MIVIMICGELIILYKLNKRRVRKRCGNMITKGKVVAFFRQQWTLVKDGFNAACYFGEIILICREISCCIIII